MSNNKRVNRKRRRGPWYKMFAKTETRLSARVTSEEDWQTDVPNIRLSRAFVIVLLMHLVVGGALIAFTLMNPSEASARSEADGPPANSDKVAAAGERTKAKDGGKATSPTGTVGAGKAMDDMRRHIVHSGDSVAKIARQYGITPEEIHAVNRIDELYQLYQGRVIQIPVSVSSPVYPGSRIADAPSTNGSKVVSSGPSRNPTTLSRVPVPVPVPNPVEIGASPDREPIKKSLLSPPVEEVVVDIEEPSRPVVIEEPDTPAAPAVVVRKPGIVRPDGIPEVPVAPPAESRGAAQKKTYKVVKGDNPFRIAQRFGIHYKELLKHNGITDPSKLQIGQTLNIPN